MIVVHIADSPGISGDVECRLLARIGNDGLGILHLAVIRAPDF